MLGPTCAPTTGANGYTLISLKSGFASNNFSVIYLMRSGATAWIKNGSTSFPSTASKKTSITRSVDFFVVLIFSKDSKREEIKTSAVVEKQSSNNDTNEHKAKKLSYKDQRELDALPAQIEEFEDEVEGLQQQMADSNFYKKDQDEIKNIQQQLAGAQEKLSFCYTRWEELE